MRGVELGGGEHAEREAGLQVAGIGGIGEVERHQRGECAAPGQRRHDPVAIGGNRSSGRHRGRQVGHDNRPGKLARGIGQDIGEHGAIAQVDVPVVGLADDEALRLAGIGHGILPYGALPNWEGVKCASMLNSLKLLPFTLGKAGVNPCRVVNAKLAMVHYTPANGSREGRMHDG